MVFGPEHYSARASELEAAGERISDLNIRMSYLELARSFREMANLASLTPRPALKSTSSRLPGARLAP